VGGEFGNRAQRERGASGIWLIRLLNVAIVSATTIASGDHWLLTGYTVTEGPKPVARPRRENHSIQPATAPACRIDRVPNAGYS
jgi:hypothetical protein